VGSASRLATIGLIVSWHEPQNFTCLDSLSSTTLASTTLNSGSSTIASALAAAGRRPRTSAYSERAIAGTAAAITAIQSKCGSVGGTKSGPTGSFTRAEVVKSRAVSQNSPQRA
jgi:hypothetical protein